MFKRIMCLLLCIITAASLFVMPANAAVGDNDLYESESNNSRSLADRIYDDYTIFGSAGPSDVDYYKFVLSGTSTVTLLCTCSYSTIYVGIEDSAGNAIHVFQPTTLSSSGSSYTFSKQFTLSAGTYYIGVLSTTQVSYSKSYALYFDYVTAAHTHTYSNACDTTCNSCGATRTTSHSYSYTCDTTCNSCGATRTASHKYASATCTEAKTCSYCGITSGSALGHKYSNDCDASCNRCGDTRSVPGHIYDNDCDETCNECEKTRTVSHSYDGNCDEHCNICGLTREAPHFYDDACDEICNVCDGVREAPHAYDDVCDAICNLCEADREPEHAYSNGCDAICDGCGESRIPGEHVFSSACDADCNECGETRVASDHVYDHACDTRCNVCNEKRSIKHTYTNDCDTSCNVCGNTRTIKHSYKTSTKRGTLSKDGSIVKKCTVCGHVDSKTTIKYVKTFTLSATSYTYDGKVKTPSVTVKDSSGKTLKKGTDYTVTYSSGRKNAGTYKVTIKMMGNYYGTKTLTFKIKPIDISKCKITLSTTDYSYSGKTRTPSVTVKNANGTKLGKDTHYTVSYSSGRKNVGTYKVTVKMKGNYTGTKTLTYTVKPTTKTSANLLVGETFKIGAKSNKSISYSSSDRSVATVDSKGVITAKKAGTATITVKSNGITQKITVKVKTPYVKVSGTNSMLLKKSVTLKATSNTTAKVTWSSSDTKIATVSSTGKVTGQKVGTATITAKISYKGKTYTCKYKVTVKKPALEKTSATIRIGQKYEIGVKGGSGTITYTSSNKSVATVNSKGVITGLKKGTATITVKRNGYSMSFKVTVKDYSDIVLYEDATVKITFKGAEKYKYDDERVELYFNVQNKKGRTLLIQADAVSLNGYSFCNLTMSDEVAGYSTGTVCLSVSKFDFDLVDINKITSIGGQFRIIDDATWKSYDAIWKNIRLDGKGTAKRPTLTGKKLLYSDSNCAIYYKSAEKYKYSDDRLEMYFYVENKTNKTLLIQADAIVVNGYSFSNLTMSDPVLAQSIGTVNVSVSKFDFSTISVKSIKKVGGQLRIIDDATWSSYDAVFASAAIK